MPASCHVTVSQSEWILGAVHAGLATVYRVQRQRDTVPRFVGLSAIIHHDTDCVPLCRLRTAEERGARQRPSEVGAKCSQFHWLHYRHVELTSKPYVYSTVAA